jgi:hypothetical protein
MIGAFNVRGTYLVDGLEMKAFVGVSPLRYVVPPAMSRVRSLTRGMASNAWCHIQCLPFSEIRWWLGKDFVWSGRPSRRRHRRTELKSCKGGGAGITLNVFHRFLAATRISKTLTLQSKKPTSRHSHAHLDWENERPEAHLARARGAYHKTSLPLADLRSR